MGRRIIGELELAYRIIEAQWSEDHALPFLAVTGSNGKSTTTTLLHHMMTSAGFRTLFGGNIGNALTEEIMKMREGQRTGGGPLVPDVVVAEVSSFQLEAIEVFQPHIASILNITPDHLDRYPSMDAYEAAKAGIFRNQQSPDILVLNADDPETMKLYDVRLRGKADSPQVCFFSRKRVVEGVYVKDGRIRMHFPHLEQGINDLELMATDNVRIKGVHNLENAMAASAMALLAGCPAGIVMEVLAEFPGLEHRIEAVQEVDGVKFINDSKGTNVGAVIKSIESFSGPLVLIAGGRDKAGNFSALRDIVAEKVRAVVLIGEASEKIGRALGDVTTIVRARDLKDAVNISRRLAEKGDVVLLSPACASFDMFLDFEDRGRQFKKIVRELVPVNA